MSDEESAVSGEDMPIEILFVTQEDQSSEDPPRSEWSSLEVSIPEVNKKRVLYSQGKYQPGSGEVCCKYIALSDSSILRHPYFSYPAVTDPGIKKAILAPEKPVIFPDDGQALYLHLCQEMNMCPVRLFHRNLLHPEINIRNYGINPRGVRAMALALQYNKSVFCLDLTGNFLNDDACYHLGQMLSSNVTLKELILAGCKIGSSGIHLLGDTLPINRSLTSLNISNNNLGDSGGLHFAKQLYDGATVKIVNLSNNQLGRETALALAEVWEWRNRFTHLNLSWNTFYHAPSTVKMLDGLALSLDLEELNLSYNALEGERIANAIKNVLLIPTLTVLDLSHNRFQNEAIDIIASSLYNARKLLTLDLSFNPLSPADAYNVLQKLLRPRIKIVNLLMENVCVKKPFLELLAKVKRMKSRKNFKCIFDKVLQNWTVDGPDARDVLLRRAQYLTGKGARKNKIDIALYFLALDKEYGKPMNTKDLDDRLVADNVPLGEAMVQELSWVFPGPKTRKFRTVNIKLIAEYIHRIWPDKELPPTPPPEPEPEPQPEEPKPVPAKGKGKKKTK